MRINDFLIVRDIIRIICGKDQLFSKIREFSKIPGFETFEFINLHEKEFNFFIDRFLDDTFFVVESPYVDKVYRDSYYRYFSSKTKKYEKNCIRVSIFNGEVEKHFFRDHEFIKHIFENYRGFFIIRPIKPYFFGRNVINPRVLKNRNFSICSSSFKSTAFENKLIVDGFPHSSKDGESLDCAQTCIWTLMEYFSSKYPEYLPTLPSKIIEILSPISYERQLPVKGLSAKQLSFVLKQMDFAPVIYSKENYKENFHNLLSCYIHSGIPLIIGITNKEQSFGHALICIGCENNEIDFNSFSLTDSKGSLEKDLIIYDLDDFRKKFVFIDDKLPPYQLQFLESPASHYTNSDWQSCEISHFIAPLHSKIYLDAYKAKKYIYENLIVLLENGNYYTRIFLTSSRTYKDYLSKEKSFNKTLKELILEKSMPKFIWVCEISSKELITENKANGVIIIDATANMNLHNFEAVIYFSYKTKLRTYEKGVSTKISLEPFNMFNGNLTNFDK